MRIDAWTIGAFYLFGITCGIITSAAIGAWLENRRYGKRVFRVQNHHLNHADVYRVFDRQPSDCEDERRKYARKVN